MIRMTEAELLAAIKQVRHVPQRLVGGGGSAHYERDSVAYAEQIVAKVRAARRAPRG